MEEERSTVVMEVGGNSEAILAESQGFDCTEEKVGVCLPVGRRMAGAMGEEMGEEMGEKTVEEMVREMACVVDTAGIPGHQRPGPTEQNTRTLVNGECKPLYQRLEDY